MHFPSHCIRCFLWRFGCFLWGGHIALQGNNWWSNGDSVYGIFTGCLYCRIITVMVVAMVHGAIPVPVRQYIWAETCWRIWRRMPSAANGKSKYLEMPGVQNSRMILGEGFKTGLSFFFLWYNYFELRNAQWKASFSRRGESALPIAPRVSRSFLQIATANSQ